MSNAAELANRIDGFEAELVIINRLIVAGNPELNILYTGINATILSLKEVYLFKAANEINFFVGKTLPDFEYFSLINRSYEQVREAYEALLGEDGQDYLGNPECDSLSELECLVKLADLYPALRRVVKERIVLEVDAMLSSAYNGRSLGTAYPIMYDGVETPWDSDAVPARTFFEGIPFKYNRQDAAQRAISFSRSNFASFPSGNGSAVKTSVIGSVGGSFVYSPAILSHEQYYTGSSIFLSETMFFGGYLPMIRRIYNNNDCSQAAPETPQGIDYSVLGWRICCDATNNLIATPTWKDHQNVVGFWADSDIPVLPIGSISGALDNNNPNLLRTHINFDNNGIFKLSTSQQTVEELLYPIFSAGGLLQDIDTGDYILIEQGTNGSHGFLIVGWGPVVDCQTGINAQTSNNDLNVTFSLAKQNNTIPYVADFGYGYRAINPEDPESDKTGWQQDPRPRPFYASAARIPDVDRTNLTTPPDSQNNVNFYGYDILTYQTKQRSIYQAFTDDDNATRPNWQFYKLRTMTQIPFSEIYVHSGC